jgi:hypothetical protein
MDYEIIKGASVPKKYPFDEMDIGDKVIINDKSLDAVRSAVWYKNKNSDRKFITRSGNYGIAVFRVK